MSSTKPHGCITSAPDLESSSLARFDRDREVPQTTSWVDEQSLLPRIPGMRIVGSAERAGSVSAKVEPFNNKEAATTAVNRSKSWRHMITRYEIGMSEMTDLGPLTRVRNAEYEG